MDLPSPRTRRSKLKSSRNSTISTSSKPRIGLQKRKQAETFSIVQCFVARPVLFTCCNVLLFGVVLWGTVPDNGSYTHVALESEFATRRLRSESPVITVPSHQTSVKPPTTIAPTVASTIRQERQPNEPKQTPSNAAAKPANKSSPQTDPITPVACNKQLLNRKSDTTDPNYNLKESPHKQVTATNPNMYISLHDASFDPMRWNSIYNIGNYYETGITEQFRTILQNTTKPGIVIDVGMNIGWFTIYSRAMGHQVAAFDPNPIMHTRVCESLHLNGWMSDGTVQSFTYGLGAEPAKLQLTTGKNPGKASFFEDRMAKRFRKQIEVPVVRLDDVADQQGWLSDPDKPIYLWKLDVEGYEYHVMEGAQKLLHSGRVQNILLENSNTDVRQVVEMYSTIYNAGYEIKMLSNTNGGEIRKMTVAPLNKIFAAAGDNSDSLRDKPEIAFFTRLTLNIWWTQREKS